MTLSSGTIRKVLRPLCCSLLIWPTFAFHPMSLVYTFTISACCSSSFWSRVVQHMHTSALLCSALALTTISSNCSGPPVDWKSWCLRGTIIHSCFSFDGFPCCWSLLIMRSVCDCQCLCFSESLILEPKGSSPLLLFLTLVLRSIAFSLCHRSPQNKVLFTILSPLILGLMCVLGIGDGRSASCRSVFIIAKRELSWSMLVGLVSLCLFSCLVRVDLAIHLSKYYIARASHSRSTSFLDSDDCEIEAEEL